MPCTTTRHNGDGEPSTFLPATVVFHMDSSFMSMAHVHVQRPSILFQPMLLRNTEPSTFKPQSVCLSLKGREELMAICPVQVVACALHAVHICQQVPHDDP